MNKRTVVLAFSLFPFAFAGSSFSQDDEALKKDLTAVIALQGLPCGEVVDVKVQAENDFAASCKDGNRYHVYLNAEGRVVVEKLAQPKPGDLARMSRWHHADVDDLTTPKNVGRATRRYGYRHLGSIHSAPIRAPVPQRNVLEQIVDTRGHGQLLRKPSGGE